jgi:hypothetical protein
MRTYRYLVQFEIDGELSEFHLTASGTGDAIQRAKSLFGKVISLAPIRKGVNPYDPKYQIETLEKEYYGTV